MEKTIVFKKLECPTCKNRLESLYTRGKGFKKLENYFWCSNCRAVICIKEEEK